MIINTLSQEWSTLVLYLKRVYQHDNKEDKRINWEVLQQHLSVRFYLKEKQNRAISCFSWVGSFVRLSGRIKPLHCCWEYGKTRKRGSSACQAWNLEISSTKTGHLKHAEFTVFYFTFTFWLIKFSFNLGGGYFSDNVLLLASTTDQSKCFPRWHHHRDGGPLPRVPIKLEGRSAIRDRDIPAAWHRRAEGCIYWTCKSGLMG